MAHLAEHLVGRAAELRVLEEALDRHAGAVELVGEPGIGKTRLLAELEAMADDRGCLVLSGSASELERDLPFWVFVDALDDYGAACRPRCWSRSTASWTACSASAAAAWPTSATVRIRPSATC